MSAPSDKIDKVALRAQAQRDRILNAAQQCFIRHGFHAAGMAGIAQAAQMSPGLIYRYFDNKNAIILAIIERQLAEKRANIDSLQAQGLSALESALAAAHLRFRPIVMTSLAFTLGVLPLATSSGAGAASQRAIGTGVIGGIVVGTFLAVFFVPLFFVVVRSLFKPSDRERERFAEHAAQSGITAEAARHYVDDAESSLSEADRRALHEGADNASRPATPKDQA